MARTRRIVWTLRAAGRLGTVPDAEIADAVDVPVLLIARKRAALGIAPCPSAARPHRRRRGFAWTKARGDAAGHSVPTACWLGASASPPRRYKPARSLRGIRRNAVVFWTPRKDALLPTHTARAVAQRFGITMAKVRSRRFYLGITGPVETSTPPPRSRPSRSRAAADLALRRIGRALGVTPSTNPTLADTRMACHSPGGPSCCGRRSAIGSLARSRMRSSGVNSASLMRSIYRRRTAPGVPACTRTGPQLTPQQERLLGTAADHVLAERWGD